MKKGIITLIAVAFLLPLTLSAQPGPDNAPGCAPGRGMGMGMGDGPCCPQGRADMGPGGQGMGRGRFGDDGPGVGHFLQMADELGLTDQQREQFKKMQVDFRMQMIDKDAAVDKAEVQLRSVMRDDNASEAEVGRLIDDVARLRAEVQKTRFAHHKQMKSVLTAEQVKKLDTLRKERREARQEAGQGRGAGARRGHGMGNKS